MGNLSLLQGNIPTQESNRGPLHCRQIPYQMSWSMDSTLKVKHKKMDRQAKKQANGQITALKFCERRRAPMILYMCLCECRNGGGEEMTFAWLGALCRDPHLQSTLQPSSQLTGSRRGSSGLYPQRENSSVWLEETVHEKWWQGVRRRRQVRKHFHLLSWGQWAPIREP